MRGMHLLLHWSRQQQVIALSSCEAELNALCKAMQEGLAAKYLAEELSENVSLILKTDSSAAQGVIARQGSGKVKHLSVRQLWVQNAVADGLAKVQKVPRAVKWSDMLTHHWTEPEGARALAGMSTSRTSRPRAAELPPLGSLYNARGGLNSTPARSPTLSDSQRFYYF